MPRHLRRRPRSRSGSLAPLARARPLAGAALILALAACPARRAPTAPTGKAFTGCLPLTGTSRSALRLGPGGRYLYWTEQVRLHGYEDSWPSTEVVRWPVEGGPVEPLTNALENPYRVLADGRLVGIRKDAGVAVWSPSGSELVSLSGTVDHLELLASEQAVVYREGASIWRQPLDRQAARWLAYADALLGVDGESVFIRHGSEEIVRVDAATGKATTLPPLADVAKAVPGALIVQNDLGISVRSPEGGELKPLLTGDGWQIRVGPDGVKAWRKVGPRLDGAIVGAIVTGTGADNLPPVLGGDSLEGFVRLPDGRIAYLVGHDLDGDGEVTTGDEVDVCLAAGDSREVRVEPRNAPARWRQAGDAMAALVKARLGGGTWHFAAGDAVPGVYIETPAKRGDRPAIWADVRALATALTTATGDRTLFVDLSYSDGKRGFSEWWAGTGRRVAWAGTGGATVPDLADYDAIITTTALADLPGDDDDSDGDGGGSGSGTTWAHCAGTVKNTSDHPLVELVADCVSGVEDEPIDVAPADLAPGQVGQFDGRVKRVSGANLAISVHTGNGRDEIPAFAQDRHHKYVVLDAAASEIADRTRLVYRDASASGGRIIVHLSAPDDFGHGRSSGQAQELQAGIAEEVLTKLGGEALGGDAGDEIRLRITAGDETWWYEGGHITSSDRD